MIHWIHSIHRTIHPMIHPMIHRKIHRKIHQGYRQRHHDGDDSSQRGRRTTRPQPPKK
jgi:hypothetical protein